MSASIREKVFARPRTGYAIDRNLKVRIIHAARAYNARHKTERQHTGPITRTMMDVLKALLWGFANSKTGACWPAYETIAAKARCSRDTVYRAIRILEEAELLSWVNCFEKRRVRHEWLGRQWKVFRTSNAYTFRDPLPSPSPERHKIENPSGTVEPESKEPVPYRYIVLDPANALDAALIGLGRSLGAVQADRLVAGSARPQRAG